MTNLFAKYETDAKKENDGVVVEVDEAKFFCRRAGGGNRRYRFAVAAAAVLLNDKLNSKVEEEVFAAEDEVTLSAFAESVVIGWENVTDREGKPWEFSKQNFIELMHACPDVWSIVRMQARDVDNYRFDKVKELATEVGKS